MIFSLIKMIVDVLYWKVIHLNTLHIGSIKDDQLSYPHLMIIKG
jgi:hypothetical protein